MLIIINIVIYLVGNETKGSSKAVPRKPEAICEE